MAIRVHVPVQLNSRSRSRSRSCSVEFKFAFTFTIAFHVRVHKFCEYFSQKCVVRVRRDMRHDTSDALSIDLTDDSAVITRSRWTLSYYSPRFSLN